MRNCICVGLLAVWLPACNTDPLFEQRQRVDGPTTRIDRPIGVQVRDIQIADASEVDLVEQVLSHRAMYHRALTALEQYYRDTGFETKRVWAARELADVNEIKPFRYLLPAEIPSATLVPRDLIPEADAMYEKARRLMEEGGHGLAFVYREAKLREALEVFRTLIETHPGSDKIDDAAFFCGEIHKEYFKNEEPIALRWYERAFTWEPKTPHPARFQAAVIYDYRLHDRDRALELYHQVLEHETFNQSNVSFSVNRIDALTRDAKPGSRVPASGP